jgi:hypothetical protein
MVLIEENFESKDYEPLFYFIFPKSETRINQLIKYCAIYFNNKEEHPMIAGSFDDL